MKNRKNILVIDLEATCWGHTWEQKQHISEIIEIGLVVVSLPERKIVDRQDIYIKPQFSTVSAYCTHLTGITQEQADAGVDMEEAFQILKTYKPRECVFASWGKYDDRMFYNMAELYHIKYPFNNDHLNVKALFAAKYGSAMSVSKALEFLGMKFEGRPHNGADDAYNITKILLHLLED